MKIGLVADEFTRLCLELENGIEIINLTPTNFLPTLTFKDIDLVLIESAWLGYQGTWKGKIATYKKPTRINHIALLTKLCKIKKIPTVFWNKEDPSGFDRFIHQVQHVDICLTTDENRIKDYKKHLTGRKKIIAQPFFFQPEIHNPIKSDKKENLTNKIIFCGGYYKNEFPDRAKRLKQAVAAIGEKNLVIFDRFNHGVSGWSNNQYLDVRDPFDYVNSKYYYQQGVAQLNVNSIDGLRTMFSRRMLELIACGAKVIDITCYKKKSMLSEFVIQASTQEEVRNALLQEKPTIDYQYLLNEFSVKIFIKKLKEST